MANPDYDKYKQLIPNNSLQSQGLGQNLFGVKQQGELPKGSFQNFYGDSGQRDPNQTRFGIADMMRGRGGGTTFGSAMPKLIPERDLPMTNMRFGGLRDIEGVDYSEITGKKPKPNNNQSLSIDTASTSFNDDNKRFASLVNPNNIGMSQGKKGDIRYTRDEQGNILREDIRTGAVTPLQNRITSNLQNSSAQQGGLQNEQPFRITRENTGYAGGNASIGFEQIKQAIDSGEMSPSQGLAYWRQLNATPEQQQAAAQQAQIQSLIDVATNGTGRAQRGAAAALDSLQRMRTADMESQYRMLGLGIGEKHWNAEQQAGANSAKRDQMNKDREYQLNSAKARAEMSKPIALGGGQAWSEPANAVLTQPQRLVAYNPETGDWNIMGEGQTQSKQQQAYAKAQEILANPNEWDAQHVQNAKAIVEQMRGNYQ